jgi:hypothetical protein
MAAVAGVRTDVSTGRLQAQPGRPVDLRSLPTGNVDITLNTVRARKRAGSAQGEGTNLGVVPARDRSVRSRVAVFQGVAVCHTARSALSRSAGHHVYVGLAGLEPATSCTQSTRASQAALQPVPPEDDRHVGGSFYGKEVTGGHKPIPATPLSCVAARASSQCNGSPVTAAHTVGDGSLGRVAKDGCDGIRGGGVLFVQDLHVACCRREIPVTEPVPHTLQVHPLVDEP